MGAHKEPQPCKADDQAAERLLRRAVEYAVVDLRSGTHPLDVVRARNEDRFHVAIRAAVLFNGGHVPQQRQATP